MKRAVGCWFAMIVLLVSLPGCGKLIEWGKSNFYQGQEYDTYASMAKPFVRSVTIYDEFSTQARFDVLWLSDEARTAYTDLHSARLAKSSEHKNSFLRRQLEENEHYIAFYVLAIYGIKLGTPESHWTLILEVDGRQYQPTELKLIDLPYEYQLFFGDRYNRFKEPYHVRFNARDLEDKQIITPYTQDIKLHIRSAQIGSVLTWQLKSGSIIETPKEKPKKQSKRHKRGRRRA